MFPPELIIKYINAYTINTKISPIGYCQGLASMARDAFLLGLDEYIRYRTRLEHMIQNNFLDQMQDFIQTAQLLTAGDIKIREIPAGKLKQWPLLKQYAATSLNKPENTVNAEDLYSIYLETRAFLETMTILFEPNFHNKLFVKKEAIPQYDSKTVLPIMSSCLAEEKGKICETNNFTNLYSSEEMVAYLKAISSVQTEKRFALILYSLDHTTALLYDKDTKQWIIDNHGQMVICTDPENELAIISNVLKGLLAKNKQNYAVSTKVYSLGNDQKEVTQAFSSFCKKEKLINNEASAQEIGVFLQIAAMHGHLDVVNTLLDDSRCNSNEKNHTGITALHLAAMNGHIDVVNTLLKDKLCNPNEENNEGITALDLADHMDHEEVVKTLENHLMSIENKNANSNQHPFFKPDSSNETKKTSLPLRSVENLVLR